MDKDKSWIYHQVANIIGQLLALTKLYKHEHPVIKSRIAEVFKEISELILNKESLAFSEAGGVFFVNGEEIKVPSGLITRFAEGLYNLKIGSLELKPGLTLEEFNCFIDLLSHTTQWQGEVQIKQYLKEKGIKHLMPSFATYKLVKEGEGIIKKSEILKIEEIPASVIDTFLQDLNKGEVNKQLPARDKIYKALAHNPELLSKMTFDLVKDKDNPEELAKILWLIGEYLIGEVSTVKEEEINRKILSELKDRLISLWKQKEDKMRWEEEINKTFTAINAALQIEGLIALYRKHKKELETVVDKLKEILKVLPPESQLYLKAKENLEKIGAPCLDATIIFKPGDLA